MFLFTKNKKKDLTTDKILDKKQPIKKGWRLFFVISISVLVVLSAIGAYIWTVGSSVFLENLAGASPFFKGAVGADQLKGEGDSRINILVTGMGGSSHPGGNLTDSIMVISIDPADKTMAMLSIPRDLYVPIYGKNYSRKINEAYSIGESSQKGSGYDVMKKTVSEIIDLPIHYFVSLDFSGFEKIVDSLGGVDIDVPKSINDPLYPDEQMKGYDPFVIKSGRQHLNGETALKYARSRETSSDFDRSSRQQLVIKAIKEKATASGFLTNPKRLIDLFNALGTHLRTDFNLSEIKSLASLIKEIDSSKTITKVLTNGSDGPLYSDSSSGTYLLKPRGDNFKLIQRIAHEIFSDPYIKSENAKIDIQNGSGVTGQAGTLAETLRSYGYNIGSVENAEETLSKTIIYDYTNGGKPYTLNFLKNRLAAEIKTESRPENVTSDLLIVIGRDYSELD